MVLKEIEIKFVFHHITIDMIIEVFQLDNNW